MNEAESTPGRGSSAGVHVETITDYPSFLELAPDWDRLVEAAGVNHPFLHHLWIRTWWECFGAGRELRILVVKAGERSVGIAPLMLCEDRIYGFRLRVLTSIAGDHTPRFDFIVASRSPEEVYAAIWRSLTGGGEDWDLLRLRQLPSDTGTLALLAERARRDGFLLGLRCSENSPYLRFTGSWEGYFQRLGYNHRRNVRKGFRRLGEFGRVDLEIVSSGEDLDGALEDGLRLEAAGWKGRAGTAMASQTRLRRFYGRLAGRAAGVGLLRLYFLVCNRNRIAFAYALHYRNKIFVLKTGYDPEYKRYSPYFLLRSLILRHGFEHDLAEYEFLGSDEPWKLAWTDTTRSHYWLFVLPRTPRTRFIHCVKFHAVPVLQRYRLYHGLRDSIIACGHQWRARR